MRPSARTWGGSHGTSRIQVGAAKTTARAARGGPLPSRLAPWRASAATSISPSCQTRRRRPTRLPSFPRPAPYRPRATSTPACATRLPARHWALTRGAESAAPVAAPCRSPARQSGRCRTSSHRTPSRCPRCTSMCPFQPRPPSPSTSARPPRTAAAAGAARRHAAAVLGGMQGSHAAIRLDDGQHAHVADLTAETGCTGTNGAPRRHQDRRTAPDPPAQTEPRAPAPSAQRPYT